MNKIRLSAIVLIALVIGLSSCTKKKTDNTVLTETPNVKIQEAIEKNVEQTLRQ